MISRGSQLTNHWSYVPSCLKKENLILMSPCRPDHTCDSCLLLQHSISCHLRASSTYPALPASLPLQRLLVSLPLPQESPSSHRSPPLRRQSPLLFRTKVIAHDNWLLVLIVNSPSDLELLYASLTMFHCDPYTFSNLVTGSCCFSNAGSVSSSHYAVPKAPA